jgi:hypothetical protein
MQWRTGFPDWRRTWSSSAIGAVSQELVQSPLSKWRVPFYMPACGSCNQKESLVHFSLGLAIFLKSFNKNTSPWVFDPHKVSQRHQSTEGVILVGRLYRFWSPVQVVDDRNVFWLCESHFYQVLRRTRRSFGSSNGAITWTYTCAHSCLGRDRIDLGTWNQSSEWG